MRLSAEVAFCLTRPMTFRGRTSVRPYWLFVVAQFVLCFGIGFNFSIFVRLASGVLPPYAALGIVAMFALAFLWLVMCGFSAAIRRLHDTGRSDWWYWISLVPFVGAIWLFVLLTLPGDVVANAYGPPPSGRPDPRSRIPGGEPEALTADDLRALRHTRMQGA